MATYNKGIYIANNVGSSVSRSTAGTTTVVAAPASGQYYLYNVYLTAGASFEFRVGGRAVTTTAGTYFGVVAGPGDILELVTSGSGLCTATVTGVVLANTI